MLVLTLAQPEVCDESLSNPGGVPTGATLHSKLWLVDLAGSERSAATEQLGGERAEEGKQINLSLTALGLCINTLSSAAAAARKGKRAGAPHEAVPPVHVPYRNSKLTHLLHDCLGGNCRAAMLFGLSPALFRLDETLSTLRFAMRAKQIQTVAKGQAPG